LEEWRRSAQIPAIGPSLIVFIPFFRKIDVHTHKYDNRFKFGWVAYYSPIKEVVSI
jgi:hypothetical protein